VSTSGHIVTARPLVDGCQVIAIPGVGNAERLAEERDSELALIRVYGARKLAAIGLLGAAAAGGNVTLVGIADPQAQGGGSSITAVSARLGAGGHALETPPGPGFAGAAALDNEGHVLGMAVLKPAVVAGAANAPQAAVVPLAKIKNFLEAHDVIPASGHPGVEDAKASVVRVICVRK